MKPVNLAAIDIGSNGARLLVKRFDGAAKTAADRIEKLLFIRVPLRLGKDVFSLGKISKERRKMMVQMMKGFKHFLKFYKVADFRACATSAMRDAENGKEVLREIEKKTGIKLEIIGGHEEANLLYNNLLEKTDSHVGNFAYIDVGGGSTEVSLIHDGVLAESVSYDMGTLRLLSGHVAPETEERFKANLTRYAAEYGSIHIIGSGGNINKLNKIARHEPGQDPKELRLDELKRLYGVLSELCIADRQAIFGLKEDRADVIVPAADIFIKACAYLKCGTILVPNISLADSIVDGLYEEIFADIAPEDKGRY